MSQFKLLENGIYWYEGANMPCGPRRFRVPVFHRSEDNDPTGLIRAERRLDSELDSNWAGRILHYTHRKDKWVGVSLSRLWADYRVELENSMNFIEKYVLSGWILIPWFKRKEMDSALKSLEAGGFLTKDVIPQGKGVETVYYPTPKLIKELIGARRE